MVKVTLTFKGDEEGPKTSLKFELPNKWLDGPISKVSQFFLSSYNKKNSDQPLNEAFLVNGQGQIIPDDVIAGKVVAHGDELFVLRGKPTDELKSVIPPNENKSDDEDEDINTKAGLEKMKKKQAEKHAFDYSKWDKLDLSDDDGLDCHPNIELASWKRIKAQQRAERRAKEEAEVKRLQEKVDRYKERAADESADEETKNESLRLAEKYNERLQQFISTRKWVADDVCDTKEDRSIVNKKNEVFPPPGVLEKGKIGPENPEIEYESYDSYVKQHEPTLREFVAIENNRDATEKFMIDHPEILNKHADGFLLLLCLDVAMKHAAIPSEKKTPKAVEKEKQELRRVVRQHLLLNYVLELAKISKVDDVRAAVRPFFLKTSKQTVEQMKEFEQEMMAFVTRIEARAKEKLEKGEKSPLSKKVVEEEEYEPAGVGPGGLDPNEVLSTLPIEMQQAFVDQDVQKLKDILSSMPPEEADYHLKRCIDSGLWVVPKKEGEEEDDDEEEEEEEEEEEGQQGSQ